MKTDNDILTELKSLSPLLAGLQKSNVFSVPIGYFESLSDTILICLRHENQPNEFNNNNDVPEGYFDGLSSSILSKIKTQQKEEVATGEDELPVVLKNIRAENIFTVPEGYFSRLADEVMEKIRFYQADDSSSMDQIPQLLTGIQQKNVFDVPTGYFDNFASSVITRIASIDSNPRIELEYLSPLLLSVQQTNVFETPQGYFEDVQENIIKTVLPAKAKVVSMSGRSIFRYAAAAVITGAMALGVYKYANRPVVSKPDVAQNPTTISPVIEQGTNMSEQQFNDVLNNLTKDDITSYLEKNGNEEDVSMLTSSPDEIDLPNQDDYLLDDKTLENYLNKINFQN